MSVGQATKSSKTREGLAIAILLVLALLLILAVIQPWEGDHGIKSQIKVSVLNEQGIETHRLRSEARFTLAFEAPGFRAKEGRELQTGIQATLQRDGKPLARLKAGSDREPEVEPPDAPSLRVAVSVPRSLKYRLPQLEPGRYEVCQNFGLWKPGANKSTLLEEAVVCLTIEVVS